MPSAYPVPSSITSLTTSHATIGLVSEPNGPYCSAIVRATLKMWSRSR